MITNQTPLRIVCYRDEDNPAIWIAHCLENNQIGDGRHPLEAIDQLCNGIVALVEYAIETDDFSILNNPASKRVENMYAKGKHNCHAKMIIYAADKQFSTEWSAYDPNEEPLDAEVLALA